MTIEIGITGFVFLLLLFLLGGASLTYLWMKRRAFRNIFLAWDPSAGPAGGFVPQRLRLGKRFHVYKGPGGERIAFPLLPGYGAPFGKNGRGVAFMGDVRSGLPIHIPSEESTDDDASGTEIALSKQEAKEVLTESGVKPTKQLLEGVQVGQAFRLRGRERPTGIPDGRHILSIIEDVRELKMLRAAKQAGNSTGSAGLIVIIILIVVGYFIFKGAGGA